MSRILALDVGDERIGLALSDETNTLARPFGVILRTSGSASYKQLVQVIDNNQVDHLIVGWPLLPDGSAGKQTRSVQAYLRGLAAFTSIAVVLWDERLSTVEANEIMNANAHSRRAQNARRDAVAAAVILQQYLDQLAEGKVTS